VWVEGGFLPPKEKVAAAALFGLPHAPVVTVAQALGPGDVPRLLAARSFFKTTLNPSLCARRWDLCEAFYAAHGREGFAEGAVAKSYQGGPPSSSSRGNSTDWSRRPAATSSTQAKTTSPSTSTRPWS